MFALMPGNAVSSMRHASPAATAMTAVTSVLCWLQVCDVSSLASVASFAANWLASSRPCHLLVNNAGVLVSGAPMRQAVAGSITLSALIEARMAPSWSTAPVEPCTPW